MFLKKGSSNYFLGTLAIAPLRNFFLKKDEDRMGVGMKIKLEIFLCCACW